VLSWVEMPRKILHTEEQISQGIPLEYQNMKILNTYNNLLFT